MSIGKKTLYMISVFNHYNQLTTCIPIILLASIITYLKKKH